MTIQIENHGELTRTFSDAGRYIIQDETGAEYQEAWDPITHPRTYTESEHIIETDDMEEPDPVNDDAALIRAAEIMLGGDSNE